MFYSGQGLEVDGRNYLVPVDARINDEADLDSEGLGLNQVLRGMSDRGADAVNLVILDASRNNPFKTSNQRAVGDGGMGWASMPSQALILYAARPGETASRNPQGRNGLFTKHLLLAMERPGVEVENVFKQAAAQVYLASEGRQDPWMEGSIRGRFCLVPAPTDPVPPGTPMPAAGAQSDR